MVIFEIELWEEARGRGGSPSCIFPLLGANASLAVSFLSKLAIPLLD